MRHNVLATRAPHTRVPKSESGRAHHAIMTGVRLGEKRLAELEELQVPPPIVAEDVQDFIRGPEGLLLGDEPYPAVVDLLQTVYGDNWIEAYLEMGIGSGKTYFASLFVAVVCADVLQQMIAGTFWKDHGLADQSRIEIPVLAPGAQGAQDVIFEEFAGKARRSPWFARWAPIDTRLQSRLVFKNPATGSRFPLWVIPRGESTKQPLGRNVYAAVIDEAGFWNVSTGKTGDMVRVMYNLISRRMRSRFGMRGKLLMISSASYEGSLATEMESKAKRPDARTYYRRASTWEFKPRDRWIDEGTFSYTERDGRGRVVKVWEGIPMDLKDDFDSDPMTALRDYGGRRDATQRPWDPRARDAFEDMPPPDGTGPVEWLPPVLLPEPGEPYRVNDRWVPLPGVPYFLHFDLAVSDDPNSCGLGVAMCHAERWPAERRFVTNAFSGERYQGVVVVVDLATAISSADAGGPRSIEDTRILLYELQALGLEIGSVSYDGFQSVDSIQVLKRRGIPARYLSTDKTVEPYTTLLRLLHSGHLVYNHDPADWMVEYRDLTLMNGKQVDHLPGNAKDASDGLAGAVHTCWSYVVAQHGDVNDGEGGGNDPLLDRPDMEARLSRVDDAMERATKRFGARRRR